MSRPFLVVAAEAARGAVSIRDGHMSGEPMAKATGRSCGELSSRQTRRRIAISVG